MVIYQYVSISENTQKKPPNYKQTRGTYLNVAERLYDAVAESVAVVCKQCSRGCIVIVVVITSGATVVIITVVGEIIVAFFFEGIKMQIAHTASVPVWTHTVSVGHRHPVTMCHAFTTLSKCMFWASIHAVPSVLVTSP